MKKFIILSLMLLMVPMSFFAQSFDALWKQVEQAEAKDLPKTQMDVLMKIQKKAQVERLYGQLLAAELLSAELQTRIAPDSMKVVTERLKQRAKAAERKDDVLAAVYNCVLGTILKGKEGEKS
ncbi:MAG: hypothetical protein K6A82_09695, partial [Prevotella sp.]|nr:hypothetical protein [Prevotella sp.]